jgi:hypothetical protein
MRKANYMGITAAAAGRHHVALLCYEDPLTNVEAANKQLSYLHNQQANKVAATKPDSTRHSAPCSTARASARASKAPSSLFLLHCAPALLTCTSLLHGPLEALPHAPFLIATFHAFLITTINACRDFLGRYAELDLLLAPPCQRARRASQASSSAY